MRTSHPEDGAGGDGPDLQMDSPPDDRGAQVHQDAGQPRAGEVAGQIEDRDALQRSKGSIIPRDMTHGRCSFSVGGARLSRICCTAAASRTMSSAEKWAKASSSRALEIAASRVEGLPGPWCGLNAPRPTIRRIGVLRNPSGLLHGFEKPRHRHLRDLQRLRELTGSHGAFFMQRHHQHAGMSRVNPPAQPRPAGLHFGGASPGQCETN